MAKYMIALVASAMFALVLPPAAVHGNDKGDNVPLSVASGPNDNGCCR